MVDASPFLGTRSKAKSLTIRCTAAPLMLFTAAAVFAWTSSADGPLLANDHAGLGEPSKTAVKKHVRSQSPLLMSALLREGRLDEARARSRVEVDGVFLGHSGFFAVPSGNYTNQLFFWLQPCSNGCDPVTTPLVQWFNGGPGSPDTVGVFNQIGQYFVDSSLDLHPRCFSWCTTRNCLFVDQPVGTGFSFQEGSPEGTPISEYTGTSEDAAQQVCWRVANPS